MCTYVGFLVGPVMTTVCDRRDCILLRFTHAILQRGTNPIYNVLPDIVGRLSVDETVSEIEFKQIMRECTKNKSVPYGNAPQRICRMRNIFFWGGR